MNAADRTGFRLRTKKMNYKNLALFTFGCKEAQETFVNKYCKVIKHLHGCESVVEIVDVVRFCKVRQYVNASIFFLNEAQAKFYLA